MTAMPPSWFPPFREESRGGKGRVSARRRGPAGRDPGGRPGRRFPIPARSRRGGNPAGTVRGGRRSSPSRRRGGKFLPGRIPPGGIPSGLRPFPARKVRRSRRGVDSALASGGGKEFGPPLLRLKSFAAERLGDSGLALDASLDYSPPFPGTSRSVSTLPVIWPPSGITRDWRKPRRES
jgi:hypothetical protein